jgi:hypothetical protein
MECYKRFFLALCAPFEGVILASMPFRFRGVLRVGIGHFDSSDAEPSEISEIDPSSNDAYASISISPDSATSGGEGVSAKDCVEIARAPVAALSSKRARSSSYRGKVE